MKIFYFLIPVLSLLLIGCSSIYTVADFASKEKFYEDFNKFATDRNFSIILDNDSSFTFQGSAKVSDDSLFIITSVQKEIKINRDEIRDIKYTGTNMKNLSAEIILKDGTAAKANNVNMLSDSSLNAMVFHSYREHIPVKQIKEVSCKNYWIGVPVKIVTCTLVGFIAAAVTVDAIGPQNIIGEEDIYLVSGITVIGLVTGAIWGGLSGYTYTYQFNP